MTASTLVAGNVGFGLGSGGPFIADDAPQAVSPVTMMTSTIAGIALRIVDLAGGGGEIRTHERLAPLTVFKTVAFNRSATPPNASRSLLDGLSPRSRYQEGLLKDRRSDKHGNCGMRRRLAVIGFWTLIYICTYLAC